MASTWESAHPLSHGPSWDAAPSLDIAAAPPQSGVSGLYALALQGQWRQVIGRCKELRPASRADSLTIATFHVLALAQLNQTMDALQELERVGNLDGSGSHAARRRHAGEHSAPDASEVPFALRWLAAELPGRAGRWMEAVSAFQALLGLCATQSGIAEREGDAEASRMWGGRRARAAAALANVHAQQQQYPAALAVLDAQLGADPRRIDTWLHAAQVQLRVGDLPGAEASVASAAFLAGEAEGPAAAYSARAVRHARGLLAVARQDWPAAAAAFSSCLREDARDAEAVGDLAVCQLFNRNVESGVAVLEAGFQAQPWAMLKAPLVSSLALMYDLARPDSGAKERFGAWVARMAPDDLDMSCLSPG
ncbi:hypothetical protein ACKKBF_B03410 [Auxenochlorella protothecoides x Auxenochlorella symbiontica]